MSTALEARRMTGVARDALTEAMENKAGSMFPGSVASSARREFLTQKWKPLLEGIETDWTRSVAAQLLENSYQYLSAMSEETRALNAGEFTKFIFPLVRRIWPNLISNNLVSVQPMTAPVGAIFFFEYKYGTSKGGVVAGNNLIESFDQSYSSDLVDGETVISSFVVPAPVWSTPGGIGLDFKPIIPGTFVMRVLDSATGALLGTLTDTGTGGLVATVITIAAGATIDYTTGTFNFTVMAGVGPATINLVASYRYNMEMNADIPQVNLDISFSEVRAQTRKLKALWSPEASDDLRAFHGSDIETELVAGIASQMALEIDRQILSEITTAAETAGAVLPSDPIATWNASAPPTVPDVFHIRSILTNISVISALIQKKTLRGFANWIVTSPEISALLLQLASHGDFRPIWSPDGSPLGAAPEQVGGPYGMYKFGILGNRWNVYVDPYFPRDKMLIGLKGQSFLDTGYVYAPYIPLQVTPTLFDPGDQSFRKGLRTRYATKLINPKFYAVLKVVKS